MVDAWVMCTYQGWKQDKALTMDECECSILHSVGNAGMQCRFFT